MIGATLTYNENVDKIRPVKKKNHSVHEGTVPADLGSTDVMMQDFDEEPKKSNRRDVRTSLSLSLSLSCNTSTVKNVVRKIPPKSF